MKPRVLPRRIPKEVLEDTLRDNPDITLDGLKVMFRCGTDTIRRELARHGLRTKIWSERQHTAEARQKMSQHAASRTGSLNPNFGKKSRPWLEGDRHPFRQWHKQNPSFGENQRGLNNPIHKVSSLYQNPAYVALLTRGLRAHVDRKRGSSYDEVYGLEKAEAYREKLRQASPSRLAKFARKETQPERTVRELLDALDVPYVMQYPLGHYTVDFYVPSSNLVIQADGDYWHANPVVYQGSLTPGQRKRRRLDASCDSYLQGQGYHILRLWERDLKTDPMGCKTRLEEMIR